MPTRKVNCRELKAPALETFSQLLNGSVKRTASTTMAVVRMLGCLLKDKELGKYIVPIVPDEARTFGMDSLFSQVGIYSPDGQNYTPVDSDCMFYYREAEDGQILQEGICETGALASFMAAGSAYAIHGVPMIPFYIFYSAFGFQRVGDMIWACGDMMCRGFLLGGTAGRTTLNGEGIQHQDGHSHILATTVPNLKSYDPAFAYELAIIIREGIRRMYEDGENIFYYITVYNEGYRMPPIPEQDDIETKIIKGGYCLRRSRKQGELIQLLASGSIIQQAITAADRLEEMGYGVNIWSITSYTEMSRDADACERLNRLHTDKPAVTPYVQKLFEDERGIFIAASDFMKSLPNSIARWIPSPFIALGTDGFGLSETRDDLRNYFEISADYIIQAALAEMYKSNRIDKKSGGNNRLGWILMLKKSIRLTLVYFK